MAGAIATACWVHLVLMCLAVVAAVFALPTHAAAAAAVVSSTATGAGFFKAAGLATGAESQCAPLLRQAGGDLESVEYQTLADNLLFMHIPKAAGTSFSGSSRRPHWLIRFARALAHS